MNSSPRWLAMLPTIFGLLSSANATGSTQYLAFQIFTASPSSEYLRKAFPPQLDKLQAIVSDLRDKIDTTGISGRRLGVVVGPIAFDNTDEEVSQQIADGFRIATQTKVAIGFHVDDSMFWGRLKELNSPQNLEWLNWQGHANTGRRLDWGPKPTKVMPQFCFNSRDVRRAVVNRATLIGLEIAKGFKTLHAAKKDELFLGVIAGWETQIGRDYDTGKYLGYCALKNAGYDEKHPPADMDAARAKIVEQYIELWASTLYRAGVPTGKVISHVAFVSQATYQGTPRSHSYLESANFSPPEAAFCSGCVPGLSTYPQGDQGLQWADELSKHGNPSWASSEGTSMKPAEAALGRSTGMESYLGRMYNHGAILVNLFGWGVGDANNPFRKVLESKDSLAAYQKFLRGEKLSETSTAPMALQDKIKLMWTKLPAWIQKNGPSLVRDRIGDLDKAVKQQRLANADRLVDSILILIGN